MTDAGLIERRREGSWAFFRLTRKGFGSRLAHFALEALSTDDSVLDRDQHRLEHIRTRRAELAESYFEENASHWDKLRSMHAPEAAVEAAAQEMFTPAGDKFSHLIDLGTGTGRMLELFAGTSARRHPRPSRSRRLCRRRNLASGAALSGRALFGHSGGFARFVEGQPAAGG